MINLNTNLSSLITQRSLATSTLRLNQAIEQMTTGFKINHAKDNAANYNITTNMTTKIGAYMVAEDNCAMGLNMLSTAQEGLDLISSHLIRLRALAEQASNGTYGADSLIAIQSEADSRIQECNRILNNTEYNNIELFKGTDSREVEPTHDAIIPEDAVSVLEAKDSGVFDTTKTYTIGTADDLVALQEMVSSGIATTGVQFVMTANIDMGHIANFTSIGDSTNKFEGSFDGNGYKIKNLTITSANDYVGLFGYVNNSSIKNMTLEKVNVTGKSYVGGIVGYASGYTPIESCSVTGSVAATANYSYVGGAVGKISAWDQAATVKNLSFKGNISGVSCVGGIIGELSTKQKLDSVINCAFDGRIQATGNYAGGIIGHADIYTARFSMSRCSSAGEIVGTMYAGGLIGGYESNVDDFSYLTNSYSAANVTGTSYIGGLVGMVDELEISNCYSTGSVSATNNGAGGIVGDITYDGKIYNCYSTGNISANQYVGGILGYANMNSSATEIEISCCYSTGTLTGNQNIAGVVGYVTGSSGYIQVENCVYNSETTIDSVINNGWNVDKITINNTGQLSLADMKNKSTMETYGFTEANGWEYQGSKAPTLVSNKFDDIKTDFTQPENLIRFQVGFNSGESSSITMSSAFDLNLLIDLSSQNSANEALKQIDIYLEILNNKQVEFGSVQNRLESALDEISVQYENLVSSRSTLRDADISEVSSEYIRQQILQQASATLMATANQSPSIALQLI